LVFWLVLLGWIWIQVVLESAWLGLTDLARGPADPCKQPPGRNVQGGGELEHGVDPRHSRSALKEPDLGSMKGGTQADLFLAEIGLLAQTAEVFSEIPGHLGALQQTPQSRAK
jgi:hypothetical protein